MALHFFLILNRQGKTRLEKWFTLAFTREEKQRYIGGIHRLISSRDSKRQSNFIEYKSKKLVYRRYAGLYFVTCIDSEESELSTLESIHFLVEILDTYFDNVCELDLVFNFYKLYNIIDQIYAGGELMEISKNTILDRLAYLDKLE